MTLVCGRAKYDNVWYSSRQWYRKNNENNKQAKIEECRCKGTLYVLVSKFENRDVACLLHPHECNGMENEDYDDIIAAAGDGGGGEGGGIDDAQETAHNDNNAATTTTTSIVGFNNGSDDGSGGGGNVGIRYYEGQVKQLKEELAIMNDENKQLRRKIEMMEDKSRTSVEQDEDEDEDGDVSVFYPPNIFHSTSKFCVLIVRIFCFALLVIYVPDRKKYSQSVHRDPQM